MISYNTFIMSLSLALGMADRNVNKKYRLFHLRHGQERNVRWRDSTTVNVNVGWSEYDSKSGKTKSGKAKSGKSKAAKSKADKVETYWPTYSPTRFLTVSKTPTFKPTKGPRTPTFKPTKRPTTLKPTPAPTPISSSQQPTLKPSSQPPIPSCVPLDPNPYSFEPPNDVFPKAPWSTGGDGKWAIDSTSSHTGKYSIRSPNFDGSPVLRISNATLTVCDDYEGGPLTFQVLANVLPPRDNFIVYVDGEEAAKITDVKEFTEVKLALSPGPHRVDFSYQYNVFNLDPLPTVPPEILGAVWLDSVSLGNVLPAPTSPPATEEPIISPSSAPTLSGDPVTTASPTPLTPSSNRPTLVSLQPTPNTTSTNTTTASPTVSGTTANPAATMSPNISPFPPSSNVPTPPASGGSFPTPLPNLLPTPPPNMNPTPPPNIIPTPFPNIIPTPPPNNSPTLPPNITPTPPIPGTEPTPNPSLPTTMPPIPVPGPTRGPSGIAIEPTFLPTLEPDAATSKAPIDTTQAPSISPSSVAEPTSFPTYNPTNPR